MTGMSMIQVQVAGDPPVRHPTAVRPLEYAVMHQSLQWVQRTLTRKCFR